MSISTADVIALIKNKDLGNLTEKQKQEYVDAILAVLKNEQTYLSHYPIFQEDFPNSSTSLFKELNDLIDLDGTTEEKFDEYFQGLLNNRNNLWNESLKNILTIFYNHFDFGFGDKIIPIAGVDLPDNKKFKISDIKNANAGKSFNGTPWVHKNTNIEGISYDDVRGNDKIESVLNKRNRLQFTHHQTNDGITNKYIRLLMPKYIRRVEVEDLNRNFWVIGQTITGISAYLFDDDSPIKKMFKYLSSEIVQLWENLIYLWALLKILSTRPHYETKCLVVYVPNDTQNNQLKYDNFGNCIPTGNDAVNQIKNRLKYLVDEYSKSNLIILPIIRQNNYYHNYYKSEYYPGIFCYNRYTETWTVINNVTQTFDISTYITANCVYGARQNGNSLKYARFNKISELDDEDMEQLYYCAIRIHPVFENNSSIFNESSTNINIEVRFKVTDAIAEAIGEVESHTQNIKWTISNNSITKTSNGNNTPIIQESFLSKSLSQISKAYYLGEVISNVTKSKKKEEEPIIIDITSGIRILNIGSFFPTDLYSHVRPSSSSKLEEITSTGGLFNIYTYGEHGYGIFNERIQGARLEKSSSKNLQFLKSEDLAKNQSELNFISKNEINQKELKGYGSNYLEYLYNQKKKEKTPALWITRIGLGYWTGYNGTVWNYGAFCDVFAVFKEKDKSEYTINWICPLYMFDGYWTESTDVFSRPEGRSQWRRLMIKTQNSDDFKITVTKIEGQETQYDYSLSNCKLYWLDNYKQYDYDNRPNCTVILDKKDNKDNKDNEDNKDNKYEITFDNYVLGCASYSVRQDKAAVMTDLFKKGEIFDSTDSNPTTVLSISKRLNPDLEYTYDNKVFPVTKDIDGLGYTYI